MLRPGDQFERLTLLAVLPHAERSWRCQCRCGTIVTVREDTLQAGLMRSCGCLPRDPQRRKKAYVRHGATAHGQIPPEYKAWLTLRRTYVVCARWQDSYPAFLADVGPRPSPRHVLVHTPEQGVAGPRTVRWLTQAEASRRYLGKPLRIGTEAHSVREWAKRVGISHTTIYKRLAAGQSAKEAVFTPVSGGNSRRSGFSAGDG